MCMIAHGLREWNEYLYDTTGLMRSFRLFHVYTRARGALAGPKVP